MHTFKLIKEIKFLEYLSVLSFFLAIFALTNCGFDTSEGGYAYRVAKQIVEHGQLGFDTAQVGIFITAPNGKIYAAHEIGNAIFMLPVAFINVLLGNIISEFVDPKSIEKIQLFILSFQASIYGAITATSFFAILRTEFKLKTISSFLATVALAFTTFFWTYSRNLFDGVLCGMLLTISFFLLLNYKRKENWLHLVCCFVCLGFSLITRLSMILAIFTSIIYLLLVNKFNLEKQFKTLTIALLTLIPFCIWQCWYNTLRTGFFNVSPVQTEKYAVNNALDGNIFIGLAGLLISPGKSLFIYAPLLILSIFLFKKFYQEHRKESIYIIVLTVLWFLLHAKLRSWYGAWGWGPRHFITILPILFLPFAVNIEYVSSKTYQKIVTYILAGFGFILSLSSIISDWFFRMGHGNVKDRVFVWGFWNSQPVDMLKSALQNIGRIFTQSPIEKVWFAPDLYSGGTLYAVKTINIWPVALIASGIPWPIVIIMVLPLIALIYISIRNILRLNYAQRLETCG